MAKNKVEKKEEVKRGGRSRRRRSSFERVCLSKRAKRLFIGANRPLFRMMLVAENHARRRKSVVVGGDD